MLAIRSLLRLRTTLSTAFSPPKSTKSTGIQVQLLDWTLYWISLSMRHSGYWVIDITISLPAQYVTCVRDISILLLHVVAHPSSIILVHNNSYIDLFRLPDSKGKARIRPSCVPPVKPYPLSTHKPLQFDERK